MRIYRALILPIAIYGAESWTLRQADKRQLDTFEMRMPTSNPRRKPHGQDTEWGNQAEASSSYHQLWWSIQKALEMVRTCSPHAHHIDSHSKLTRMTFSKEDHQRSNWKGHGRFLWKRLNIKPKEDRNGEGSLVGERRDTPSYAAKSSK